MNLSKFDSQGHAMLYDMQGPLFVALANTLRIKPCVHSCLTGLKTRKFTSIRDLVVKLSVHVSHEAQNDFRDRLLMCMYFYNQDLFPDWSNFAHQITEGKVVEDIQELFYEWAEVNHKHVTTLVRAVMVALRANPPLICEQASFCFASLPQSAITKITNLLYRLLLRSCAKVQINEIRMGCKKLVIQYTKDCPLDVLSPA